MVVEAAEVQASLQPWFEMECYQLGRGNRLSQIDYLDLGSERIVRESQDAAIHKLGTTSANLCTVSCCTPRPGFRFSDISSGAAAAVFFLPRNTEFDIYVPAGASTTYVSFDQDDFVRGARALDPAKWEHPPTELESFSGAQQGAFLKAIEEVLEQAEAVSATGHPIDPAVLRGTILQTVLLSTVAASSGNATPALSERERAFDICRTSRAFIAESLSVGVVPTVPQICTVANVSERTLQYAFRRYVGMTPLTYLRICRLNSVRRELRASNPDATVTAVALRYGFLHLGRFASDYHKLFGELPSQSLIRAQ
jgi:AraC family ethanolamine operon transcriptional activator